MDPDDYRRTVGDCLCVAPVGERSAAALARKGSALVDVVGHGLPGKAFIASWAGLPSHGMRSSRSGSSYRIRAVRCFGAEAPLERALATSARTAEYSSTPRRAATPPPLTHPR